ncbi:helix-turn-helix domain-containing protein [Altericroceibacterium endophyticum]|uniref:Helix-turn-helix domain-containing protein n=1 Tax=Altericroceibacterium endophyticum TaxID=1808508 RepID=A0A6I4TB42_9SPHN|nr:helix-turn-helix domain-containing protein [Altericroceibacterium endophyticum]MXO67090.1 helix-turn-helix domain-containing protein [Altericroceibacterium endophyticum]
MMECLTTDGLPSVGRAAAWGEIYATRMSHVEFVPGNKSKFDAELKVGRFGPVKLARLSVDNCSIERKQSHIVHGSSRLFNFLLQAEGASTFCHCGKESELAAGDFVLCDTGLPHYFMTNGPSVTVMVRVPGEVLRTYLPTPGQFCGQRLGRASGVTGSVAAMVQELSNDGGNIDSLHEARVARYLLEMISMSYMMGVETSQDTSAIAWQRRKDVIEFIEDNLRDSELSPASISDGLKISSRYLRTIFASGGEKMSTYILRRRLEECARQMANPAWAAHTLTEIAFSWGFNSAAHFTRTFNDKYGVSPREYRKQMLIRP